MLKHLLVTVCVSQELAPALQEFLMNTAGEMENLMGRDAKNIQMVNHVVESGKSHEVRQAKRKLQVTEVCLLLTLCALIALYATSDSLISHAHVCLWILCALAGSLCTHYLSVLSQMCMKL